jgi:hypothetical protein
MGSMTLISPMCGGNKFVLGVIGKRLELGRAHIIRMRGRGMRVRGERDKYGGGLWRNSGVRFRAARVGKALSDR